MLRVALTVLRHLENFHDDAVDDILRRTERKQKAIADGLAGVGKRSIT